MCESYNGYSNRETWATVLWLNNDQGLLSSFGDWMEVHCEDDQNEETQAQWWHHDYNSTRYAATWANAYLTPDGYASYSGGDDWPKGLAEIASDIGSLYRVDWLEVMDATLGGE